MIITNATLANLSPTWVRRGHVRIQGDTIREILNDPPYGTDDIFDVKGRLVIPGNVCGHTHLYSALARGMPPPPKPPTNFPEILRLVWWRLDRALDEVSVRSSGLIGAIDALKAGTTTLIDHHASPTFIDGSLDVLSEALDQAGARAVLCYEVTDRNGIEGRRAGIRENARFVDASRDASSVRGMFGGHASFTLDDDSLDGIAAGAESAGVGVHIHAAEDSCDEDDSWRRAGVAVAHRLDRHGIVGDRALFAHGVHLDDEELQLLGDARGWLVHNCRSNLNNSVGRIRLDAALERVTDHLILGTDGIDGDMFAESRTAFIRGREDSLAYTAEQFAQMLSSGAALASQCFGKAIGNLEPGNLADIVVLDYNPPTPVTAHNLAWHWMFAFSSGLVSDVMVGGKWVVRDREMVGVDETEVRATARREAKQVWARMQDLPL